MTQQSFFRLHGLTLKAEGSRYLERLLREFNENEKKQWLDRIVCSLQKQSLKSPVITEEVLKSAVSECSQQDNEEEQTLNVIDAFQVPKFVYLPERKKMIPYSDIRPPLALQGDCDSKALLYDDRFAVINQRTRRHRLFAPTATVVGQHSSTQNKHQLKTVDDLKGAPGKLEGVVILGMLTQLKDNKFFLEDPSGAIELDLSKAIFYSGFIAENSILLVEGTCEESILQVEGIGLPPAELASDTRKYFGSVNFFGGDPRVCPKESVKLKQLEARNADATIVFMSDVWLDDETVLDKLREVFSGFSSCPPVCFVLCGSFASTSHGLDRCKVLRDGFKSLADILLEHPDLVNSSRFVFVPSLQDPVLGAILPRPALPNFVIAPMTNRVPNCHFVSNPCRLQYCTQEIVVFREDIVEKLGRNCIQMPSSQKEISSQFAKTILCQGHLTPLPLHVSPVHWDYDHALRLYPLPDVVVTADMCEAFTEVQNDCTVANPGSFSKNNFAFKVYVPATRQMEDSAV